MSSAATAAAINPQASYAVKLGRLTFPGRTAFGLYSGHGEGLNNPDKENERGVGPLPRGVYRIVQWRNDPHLGPCVAQLQQVKGDNFGRSGFYIHGDNTALNHSASDGCIIAPHDVRVAFQASGIQYFTVE